MLMTYPTKLNPQFFGSCPGPCTHCAAPPLGYTYDDDAAADEAVDDV